MIFTYSTLLLASLTVALIVLFLYQAIMHYARSASRKRVTRNAAFERQTPAGSRDYGTWRNLAQTSPAMPTVNRNRNSIWPYREKRSVAVGTTNKVRRKSLAKTQNLKDTKKPWGW